MKALTGMLSSVKIFSTLTPEDLQSLAASARVRSYHTNDPIVLQGDISNAMFVLISGCVKVYRTSERGVDVVLALLQAPECFGEMSFIDGLPRSAGVTAIENTNVIELTADSVHQAVLNSPSLAWSLLTSVVLRFRDQNGVLESLVTKDVAGRVADLFLRLSLNHGERWVTLDDSVRTPTEPIVIALSLSQSEIGKLIGATRERVSRIMAEMTREKIIAREQDTGRIIVLDRIRLERMAENG
jgi:CRP-like cAMP-binding protein